MWTLLLRNGMEKESVHMFVLENGIEPVRMETDTQEWRIVCIPRMEQKLSVGAVLLFLEQRKEEKCVTRMYRR